MDFILRRGHTVHDNPKERIAHHRKPRLVTMPIGREQTGKRSGGWVFRDTRTPVSVVFDNLEVGATVSGIMDWGAAIGRTGASLGDSASGRKEPADISAYQA
jgi:hypothetical protein